MQLSKLAGLLAVVLFSLVATPARADKTTPARADKTSGALWFKKGQRWDLAGKGSYFEVTEVNGLTWQGTYHSLDASNPCNGGTYPIHGSVVAANDTNAGNVISFAVNWFPQAANTNKSTCTISVSSWAGTAQNNSISAIFVWTGSGDRSSDPNNSNPWVPSENSTFTLHGK